MLNRLTALENWDYSIDPNGDRERFEDYINISGNTSR
jgi:hypothetical protein